MRDTFQGGVVAPTGTDNLLGQIAVGQELVARARQSLSSIRCAASAAENAQGLPMRSVYAGLSKDAKL